ncbi:MAG: cobalamin-binding protein [Pseudomonadota bacterium]|nr:cobalamin-binding protein [Pseudomonadota bacterium]
MTYTRIACLSTEVVETIYLLGAEDRIAGISGFTVYPARARKEKPKISGFSSARIDRILAVQPDLVIAFSDLQADIVAELIRRGIEVHVYNHRDVRGIFEMIASVAALIGDCTAGERLNAELERSIAAVRKRVRVDARRPRVYFEEWDEPLISGIGWVGELIAIAGGDDCFPELSRQQSATGRVIGDPSEVVRRAPDILIASWCGKKARVDQIAARPGWSDVPAVREHQLFEIKSADILAPGPSAITRGLAQMADIVQSWTDVHSTLRVADRHR